MGEWVPCYNTGEPVTDATQDVYETTMDWDGESKRTLVFQNLSPGWNYFRVLPPTEPVLKGKAWLYYDQTDIKYFGVWIGDSPEPPPTLYYQGGATGAFDDLTQWSRSPDGLVPASCPTLNYDGSDPTSVFKNATVYLIPAKK